MNLLSVYSEILKLSYHDKSMRHFENNNYKEIMISITSFVTSTSNLDHKLMKDF